MEGKPKYTYKDMDGKTHWTRGRFIGWQRGGLLNVWHAGFERERSATFVAHFLLTPETLAALPPCPHIEEMNPNEPTYWHFLADDGRMAHTGELVEAGKTYRIEGEPVLCVRGLHASARALDALKYARGAVVCLVTLGGTVVHGNGKAVAQAHTVLAMADATTTLHEFACWCAEQALALVKAPDPRSLAAIATKRRWLLGEATDDELAAARAAADAAARAAADAADDAADAVADAADDAARAAADAADAAADAADAAWIVARAAADAADDAWVVARAAADAADDAWVVARAAQNEQLEAMLRELLDAGESA